MKLGLIAGGGALPVSLARHCSLAGRPLFVLRIKGYASPELNAYPGADVGLAQLGKTLRSLRDAHCESVCLAGIVDRPDFSKLNPDLRGVAAMPGAIAAARGGDDQLLTFLLSEFEKEGFHIEGAHEVTGQLCLPLGQIGRFAPAEVHKLDIERSVCAANAIGALDAGQAAVSCDGLILALEAQEGTDEMLSRVAGLSTAIRGVAGKRRGVLAKICKPNQDVRVDLPTIGPQTILKAAEAGLAGIVGQHSRVLVVNRDDVIGLADELGLFVAGI